MRQLLRVSVVCLPIVLLAATALFAQAGTPSASDFYLQYRKAFDAAKKIEDVLPFMVPAGIVAVNRAQERGFSISSVT